MFALSFCHHFMLFVPDPGGLPAWAMCGSQAQLSHLGVDEFLCSSCKNALMQLPYVWGWCSWS